MSRKTNTKTLRNKFYIITNGKKTEYNYFDLLKSKKSIYDVKIIFQNSDPFGLVNLAKKYLKEANQVWIVFDIDNTKEEGVLDNALEEAKKIILNVQFQTKHLKFG